MSSAKLLITHKDNNNTIKVYSVTVMTHVIALEDGQSSQGAHTPITRVTMNGQGMELSKLSPSLHQYFHYKNYKTIDSPREDSAVVNYVALASFM